jgi:thioredoxin-like negative regulator of GroEL
MAKIKYKPHEILLNFFYRDNSPDCQITRRALYHILNNYLDKIVMHEINFDRNKEICDLFHVYGVPTLLIIKNNKILTRYSGILDPSEINVLLDTIINITQYGNGENI